MSDVIDFVECPNCLAASGRGRAQCQFCRTSYATGDGAAVPFDETARRYIAEFGGIFGGIDTLPRPGAHLVWCETGVFRYDIGRGVKWSSSPLGLVDSVEIVGDHVVLALGSGLCALDIDTGKAT